jgi:hypothetical protein
MRRVQQQIDAALAPFRRLADLARRLEPDRILVLLRASATQAPTPFEVKLQALFAYLCRELPGDTSLAEMHRFLNAWARFVEADTDDGQLSAARILVSFPAFISQYFPREAVRRAICARPVHDESGRDRRAQVRDVLARALCDIWTEEACRPQRLRWYQRGPYIKALAGGWTRSGPDQPAVPVPEGAIVPVIPVFRVDVVHLYRFLRDRTKKRAAAYLLSDAGYVPREVGKRTSHPTRAARERAALVLATRRATADEARAQRLSATACLEDEARLQRLLELLTDEELWLAAMLAHDMPRADIAAAFGWSMAATYTRIHRYYRKVAAL